MSPRVIPFPLRLRPRLYVGEPPKVLCQECGETMVEYEPEKRWQLCEECENPDPKEAA